MKGNFSVGFLIGFLSGELGDAFNHGGDFLYGLLKQAVQGGGIDALFQIVLNRFLIPDSFLGLSMEKAAVLVNANAVKQSVVGTRCKGQQLCCHVGIVKFAAGMVPMLQNIPHGGKGVVHAAPDGFIPPGNRFQILLEFLFTFSKIMQKPSKIGRLCQPDGPQRPGGQLCGTPAVLPNRLYLSGLQNMRRVHINHHPATPLF